MKFTDLIAICVRNLTRRKFRTFLTVFGVVVGTASIIIMISLGVGISASYDEMLASQGDLTMIDVYKQSDDIPITDESIAAVESMPGVEFTAPLMRWNPNSAIQIYAGRKDRYTTWANLVGVNPETLEHLGYKAGKGELKLGSDNKKTYIIMGSQVPYNFSDTKKRYPNDRIDFWQQTEDEIPPDPLFDMLETDMTLRVSPAREGGKELEVAFKTTGIIKFSERDWDSRYNIYIAIDDLKDIKARYEKENKLGKDDAAPDSYESMKVKVSDIENVGEVQAAIKEMGFYTNSLEEIRESLQQNIRQIQLILGILGGVALFVAAISIINTMLMAVTERTREIGVMKVLGCLVGNIRTIFLVEAGIIGFLGGACGIAISYLFSFAVNTFGGSFGGVVGMPVAEGSRMSIIPPWLVLTGLSMATVIGVAAGFYPANRAVRISALEAIKQE